MQLLSDCYEIPQALFSSQKSANLHIQDGRHGLICISDINTLSSR